ncbi:hypothetical protein MRB53_026751 [Persea americana]|uniref:Uncharacterized protein n=1 Tax=Persea americana TaxID=3435 RepID=A0ACC2LJ92_PERAE|nr:hypothetical protein MRB53_026751 [Persea americana]
MLKALGICPTCTVEEWAFGNIALDEEPEKTREEACGGSGGVGDGSGEKSEAEGISHMFREEGEQRLGFGILDNGNGLELRYLRELSLGGMLAPEIGKLSNLRALVLYKNNFSGDIPKEVAEPTMLELLDLRGNNLTGTIPIEIGHMLSLKYLLLCENKFQESIPTEFGKLTMSFKLQCDQDLSSNEATEIDCINS